MQYIKLNLIYNQTYSSQFLESYYWTWAYIISYTLWGSEEVVHYLQTLPPNPPTKSYFTSHFKPEETNTGGYLIGHLSIYINTGIQVEKMNHLKYFVEARQLCISRS